MIKKIKITGAVLGIAASVFLLTFTALAWTGPSQAPPGGNLPPVLNQSTDSQYKEGALGIGGVFETDTDTHLGIDGGNVGIGITTPDDLLHVYDNYDGGAELQISNASTGTSSYAGVELDGQGNNFFLKNWGDGSSYPNITEFISTAGGSEFVFSPSNSESMRIDAGGNVGIGTADPISKLQIKGTGSELRLQADSINTDNSSAIVFDEGSGDDHFRVQYDGATGSGSGRLRFMPSTGTEVSILRNGNVGIGTTTPRSKIEVQPGDFHADNWKVMYRHFALGGDETKTIRLWNALDRNATTARITIQPYRGGALQTFGVWELVLATASYDDGQFRQAELTKAGDFNFTTNAFLDTDNYVKITFDNTWAGSYDIGLKIEGPELPALPSPLVEE